MCHKISLKIRVSHSEKIVQQKGNERVGAEIPRKFMINCTTGTRESK